MLTVIAALVVLGGLKSVASVTEKLVPLMSAFYIIGAVVIMFMNIEVIGDVFVSIFKYAFTARAAVGGAVGTAIKLAMMMGFKRGIFSNEAGLGSSVIVNSTSNVKEPVRQGMWGIFEVFFDTIIICTLTAIVVLSSGIVNLSSGEVVENFQNIASETFVAEAFSQSFGSFGGKFISISILFFAFSTVLGWSYYGTKSWSYLFGEKSAIIYKIVFVGIIFVSSILKNVEIPWNISDTFNGLMMIPNLIGVVALCPVVMKLTKNYLDRKKGKDISPLLSYSAEIQKGMEKN